MPKSFRLTKEAQEVLKALAEDYDLSEAKVLNTLLIAPNQAAENIIRQYLINKLENTYNEQSKNPTGLPQTSSK